jgi:hypothetical protein
MSDTPESILARHLADLNGVDYDAAIAAGHSDHDFISEFGSKGSHEDTPVEMPHEAPSNRDIDVGNAAVIGGALGIPVAGAMTATDVLGAARDKLFGTTPAPAPKVRAPMPPSTMIPVPKNLPTTEFSSPELMIKPKDYVNPYGYGEPAVNSVNINQDISDVHSGSRNMGTMGKNNPAPKIEGFERIGNNRIWTPEGANVQPTAQELFAARQAELNDARQKAMDKIQRANLSEAAKQEARRAYLAQEGSRRALESSTQIPVSTKSPSAIERFGKVLTPGGMGGKILNKIIPVGALAGAGAEFADASNRYHHGDTPGAIISGLGALGSAASVIPTPLTRGIGTALSLGAPALNYAIDKYRKPPVKKADGGGIRLSQDEIINNALNRPSRAEVLKRAASMLGQQALDQGKKEFKSYSKPHAFTDVGNDWVSTLAGMPVDMANMALQPIGLGSDNPVLGSKYLRQKMIDAGMHTGEERPMTNIASSFIMPQTAAKGVAKGLELAKDLPAGMSIKDVGGNWNPIAQKYIENQLGKISQNADVNNWAATTGRKYILNRLGSPQDEVKHLYDKGISHMTRNELLDRADAFYKPYLTEDLLNLANKRNKAGFPERGSNTYEDVTDAAITPLKASHFQENGDLYHGGMPDWVYKLDPNATLHDESFFADIPTVSGMDKLTQALEKDIAAGKLRPEQLNKVSMEDAVRRAHQQKLESESATEKASQSIPKVREYPEGYAWHELTHEDPKILDAILKKEGDTMQNCIGGYCSDVLEDGTKLYSLRDKAGNPHVNVEVINNQDGSPMIRQIKGKQNDMPVEDYHPYVQDFIKNPVGGSDFSTVGDIAGTGLMDADRIRKHGIVGDSMNPYYGELNRIFPAETDAFGSRVLGGQHGVRIPTVDMMSMATEDMPGKYVSQQDVLNHLATKEPRPVEHGYSKYYEGTENYDNMPHMAGGRLVESFTKIPEAYRKAQAMIEAENNRKKFSQVLVPHIDSYLGLTQSDNFGIHGDRMGGNQFSLHQQFSPLHKDNRVVWMNDSEKHANTMAKNSTYNNKPVVWSTYIGRPDQLKSNKTVFQDILENHYNRDLSKDQINRVNNRIATVKDPKGNLIFPQAFDIQDKFATNELAGDTFARRGSLADILGLGEGVGQTKSGIALPQYEDILASHRDPLTVGQGTSSIGSRLFTVDPTPSSYSTLYHPDYNWTVHGEDLDQPFNFTPHSVLDWYDRQFNKVNIAGESGKVPHGNSWFNYMKDPQYIDENFIRKVEDAGYATGGQVPHMAGGGGLDSWGAGIDPEQAKANLNAPLSSNRWNDKQQLVTPSGKIVESAPSATDAALAINQFMPVTGDIQSGVMAANDLANKQYGSAALNALGVLPFVPSLGGVIKNTDSAANRINMNYKDVTKRVPELGEAFKKLMNGEIGHEEYDAIVNQYKPVTPFSFVPTPATREEAVNALQGDRKNLYGVPSQTLKQGHPVGLRLDIPAYRDHGVWVPTIHEQKAGFGAGKAIGHESVASVLNPSFGMSEEAAASIASGKPKGTIATIKGEWNQINPDEAVKNAQYYIDHPDWIQVGMDPERHSFFYDRATMQPVTHAEEALQIGPLVFAKKPKYGNRADFKYAKGGQITPSQMRQELLAVTGTNPALRR